MSQYRNPTRKPCTRPVAACHYDYGSRYRCNPTETKHFYINAKYINARN